MAKISETLRRLRVERGMTQEEVAEQVGLTRQAVSSYESGRTQPGLDILERLAQVYEVELTDVIYGRNQGIRLYNGLKVTAIVMAAVFLAVQLASSILLWVANRFFALAPGMLDEAGKATLVTRGRLMTIWEALDGMYLGLLPLCCVALLVLTLCLRRPLGAKVKVLSVLGYAAASMVVVLPWALSDSFYPAVNYLITPELCLACLAFFLLASLVIDFFRGRRQRREGDTAEGADERKERPFAPVHKRWWFWALIAVAVGVMVWLAVLVSGRFGIAAPAEIPPVENPAFTLNGEDYPEDPIVQDFLDRGWKLGKSLQQTGNYSEEKGVSNLVVTGYRLDFGEYHVSVNLDVEDVRSGLEPEQCRIISLTFYGEHVLSFGLDGAELSDITSGEIKDVLGEPDKREELAYGGTSYRYALPEKSISEISFIFKNADAPVGQIMVVFHSILDEV